MSYSSRNCMVSKEVAEKIREREAIKQRRHKKVEMAFLKLKEKMAKKEGENQNGSF